MDRINDIPFLRENGKERQVIYEGWSLFASDQKTFYGCKPRSITSTFIGALIL